MRINVVAFARAPENNLAAVASVTNIDRAAIFPFMFATLLAPVAKIVTFPPGPGAAASSNERSSEVLDRLIATPLGLPLFNAMLPPRALRRLDFAEAGSAEETSIRELTAIESLVEVKFTVPPLPCGEKGDCR
jgi:hypothetical protein